MIDAQSHTVCALGDWENAVTLTTPEDIGQLTADIFFHQPRFQNEIVYIAGDTLTYRELAELMRAHWGTEVNRTLLDGQKLLDDVQHDPHNVGAKYRLAFARPDGVAWNKRITYNHHQGIATTTASQWLAAQHDL